MVMTKSGAKALVIRGILAICASPSAACKVPCEQYFGTVNPDGSLVPDNPPTPETLAFCEQHAHLSVNVPQNPLGYSDSCTFGGKLVFQLGRQVEQEAHGEFLSAPF